MECCVLPAGAGWTTSRNWKPQWISRGRYDWRAWKAPPCSELPSNTATISAPMACNAWHDPCGHLRCCGDYVQLQSGVIPPTC